MREDSNSRQVPLLYNILARLQRERPAPTSYAPVSLCLICLPVLGSRYAYNHLCNYSLLLLLLHFPSLSLSNLTSHHFLPFPNHPASSLSHILTTHMSTLSFSTYFSLLPVTFWLYCCRQVSALVQTTSVCGHKLPVYEALGYECMRP